MKYLILFFSFLIISGCAKKVYNSVNFKNRIYNTQRGHVYGINTFKFEGDSSYTYIGSGPAMTISKGFWHYEKESNSIFLRAVDDERYKKSNDINGHIDTIFIDLSKEKIEVVNNRQIKFKGFLFNVVK